MLKKIKKEKRELEKVILQVEKKLETLPQGNLRVSTSHDTYQYYVDGKYTSKKKCGLLEGLALREYYEKLKNCIEEVLPKLDALITIYELQRFDASYNSLPMGKKALVKESCYITLNQRIELFENEKYEREELPYEITTDIYTAKGEHVRSKSEKIIADELYRRGIPYKYEKPCIVSDRGRKIVLHPDFTAMNTHTGKMFIIEHLGIMDNPDYFQNAMRKIGLYEKNGYLLGRDILVFHESSEEPLNIRTLIDYIEEYLV